MLLGKKITFNCVFEDFNRTIKKAEAFMKQTTAEVDAAKATIAALEAQKADMEREIDKVGVFKEKLSDFLGDMNAD